MTTTTNSERDALLLSAEQSGGDAARVIAAAPDPDEALSDALRAVVREINDECLDGLAERVDRGHETRPLESAERLAIHEEAHESSLYGRAPAWWRGRSLRWSALAAAQWGVRRDRRGHVAAACVSLVIHAGLAVAAGWIMLSPDERPDARDLPTHATLGSLVLLDQHHHDAETPTDRHETDPREGARALGEPVPTIKPEPSARIDTEEPPLDGQARVEQQAETGTDAEFTRAASTARAAAPHAETKLADTRVADAMIATTDALSRTRQERARFEHERAVRLAAARVVPPSERWAGGRAHDAPAGRSIPAGSVGTRDPATTTSARVTFAGAGASGAESVVYAVDASGPMVTSLPLVLAELRRSVASLGENQRFSVVLFREGTTGSATASTGVGNGTLAHSEVFSAQLVEATIENKRALDAWLTSVQPGGRSNPLVGLELALGLKPQVIFLFSRSLERSGGGVWGQGLWATLDRLEELNPPLAGASDASAGGANAGGPNTSPHTDGLSDMVLPESVLEQVPRAVQIQTIAFLDDDPTGTMQAIARRHGPRRGWNNHSRDGSGVTAYVDAAHADGAAGYRVVRRSEDLADQPR